MFKDKIPRGKDARYFQTDQRPDDVCMNWGFHNPNRSLTEKRAPAIFFGKKAPNVEPNPRFYKVPPSILNKAEDTLESR